MRPGVGGGGGESSDGGAERSLADDTRPGGPAAVLPGGDGMSCGDADEESTSDAGEGGRRLVERRGVGNARQAMATEQAVTRTKQQFRSGAVPE